MSAPDGWKLVPMEPTPDMVEMGTRAAIQWSLDRLKAVHAYDTMLAAAPPAPAAATVPDARDAEIARLLAALDEADAALDEADDRFSRIADWATNTGIAAQDETDWRERMKIIAVLAGRGDGGEGV